MAAIVRAHCGKFGKRELGIIDLATEAAGPIVQEFRSTIDLVIVANSYSGEFTGSSGVNNLLTSYWGLDAVPSLRVDNTSGSGGAALLAARAFVDSGRARHVLVVGVEKMTGVDTKAATGIIASLLPPRERTSGASLPSLAGLLAARYLRIYDAPREAIAQVAVKNRYHGTLNPMAHLRREVTLAEVLGSRPISEPLRLFEYCPISDGAAALLVTSDDRARELDPHPVTIQGAGFVAMSSHLTARADLSRIDSVHDAAERAYREAGVSPDAIDVAELHDMASILEIVESEEVGLFPRGEGWKAAHAGVTRVGGRRPLNTSGGLLSKGHPIGASGVAQAAEVFWQLRGEAGARQVPGARHGLSVSMAGFGNSASAIIYGRAS